VVLLQGARARRDYRRDALEAEEYTEQRQEVADQLAGAEAKLFDVNNQHGTLVWKYMTQNTRRPL
jgi:hypothetical protein